MKLAKTKSDKFHQLFETMLGDDTFTYYGDDSTIHLPFMLVPVGYKTENENLIDKEFGSMVMKYESELITHVDSLFNRKLDKIERITVYLLRLENKERMPELAYYPMPEPTLNNTVNLKVRATFSIEYGAVVYTEVDLKTRYMPNLQDLYKLVTNEIGKYAELDDTESDVQTSGVYSNIEHSGDAFTLYLSGINLKTYETFTNLEYDSEDLLKQLVRIELLSVS